MQELYQLFLESTGVCTDTRKIHDGCIFFALKGGNFNGNKFAIEALTKGAGLAVVDDPEIRHEQVYLVDNVLQTLQQLASYHRDQLQIPVIGITGSNGKTTTKELIHAVLSTTFNTSYTKGNLNNHIGVPLTLLQIDSTHEIAIVEMGANHVGEIALLSSLTKPTHGLITNIGTAHIEGFGGRDGVIKGKTELYHQLASTDGMVFVNGADPLLVEKSQEVSARVYYLGEQSSVQLTLKEGASYLTFQNAEGIDVCTHLIGDYNFPNAASALAIGQYFGVPLEKAEQAIADYRPSNNRSEIRELGEVTLILDAYNANPSSMEAALENFKRMEPSKKAVILGDMFELGDIADEEHQRIFDLAENGGFQKTYYVGSHFFEALGAQDGKVYASYEDLALKLQESQFSGFTILVKGSRGMALERVQELFRTK